MSLERMLAPWRDACDDRALQLLHFAHQHVHRPTQGPLAGEVQLGDMSQEALAAGGKRLRALLVPALVHAGGGPAEAALDLGACIELIHNGTLVHDDIQDGDRLRRGLPTLWTTRGVPQAINAGDYLLVGAIGAVLRAERLPGHLRPVLAQLLADALLETIRGQVADIALRDHPQPGLDDLAAVHVAKTGPLFAACLVGSAHLLGLEAPHLQAARTLGTELGLAFQVRDDLLDVLGVKGRGEAGADLREGKPTFPVLLALEDAEPERITSLHRLLRAAHAGSPPSPPEVAQWVAWVRQRGGVEATQLYLEAVLQRSRQLGQAAFPGPAAQVVDALCDRLARLDG